MKKALKVFFCLVLLSGVYPHAQGQVKTIVAETNISVGLTESEETLKNFVADLIKQSRSQEVPWNAVDQSYGGQNDPWEAWPYSYSDANTPNSKELAIGKLSIPKIDFQRESYQGIGKSIDSDGNPIDSIGVGDFQRMYRASGVRPLQIMGGENFVLASHASMWQENQDLWFTPLLSVEGGGIAVDINDDRLILKLEDKIIFEQYSTGAVFTFKISEFGQTYSDDPNELFLEQEPFLAQQQGRPMLTLQGCLTNITGQAIQPKFWVVADLYSVSKDGDTYLYNPADFQ